MSSQPSILGHYKVERTLGKGAMGTVYEGTDLKLHRKVAIKTFRKADHGELGHDYSNRFIREAQAVARLNHPNIVQVYDFGEEDDTSYIVMELIHGGNLKTAFEEQRFSIVEAVRIMTELLDALDFAHRAGVIHRDIKPANIMLDRQKRTKLTDFGVARFMDVEKAATAERTQAGTIVGTPAYMSPEQVQGQAIDHRSDIFSAGVILYHFLTGRKPFDGGAYTVSKRIVESEPPRPSTIAQSISPIWDDIVGRAMAKLPERRYTRAREFSDALRRALEKAAPGADPDATLLRPDPPPEAKAAVTTGPHTATAKPGSTTATQDPRVSSGAHTEAELEFWRSVRDSDDPDDLDLYVEKFPEGLYVDLAKRKAAKLRKAPGVAAEDDSNIRSRETEDEVWRSVKDSVDVDDIEFYVEKFPAGRYVELANRKIAKLKRGVAHGEDSGTRTQAELARREAEEKARLEAEDKARQAEEAARREAEEKARQEAEARARREAEEQARREAEEKARLEAEEKARQEAEEKARQEAEARARREAEEQARRDAEERARQQAIEKARRDAEERGRREAEELSRREAEDKRRREAAAAAAAAEAKRQAELKAKREAEERARRDEQERREAEERARRDAEARAKREAEEQARREAEAAAEAKRQAEKAKREADERAAAEAKRQAEQARREAEEAEKKQKAEKAKRDAEEKSRREAETAAAAAAAEAKRLAEHKAKRQAEEAAKREAAVERAAVPAEPAAVHHAPSTLEATRDAIAAPLPTKSNAKVIGAVVAVAVLAVIGYFALRPGEPAPAPQVATAPAVPPAAPAPAPKVEDPASKPPAKGAEPTAPPPATITPTAKSAPEKERAKGAAAETKPERADKVASIPAPAPAPSRPEPAPVERKAPEFAAPKAATKPPAFETKSAEAVKPTPAPAVEPTPAPEPPKVEVAAVKPPEAPAPPRLVNRVEPKWPREAVLGNIEGQVKARMTLDANGRVTNVVIVDATPRRVFDRNVVDALSEWRYNEGPAGRIVETEISFRR